MRDTVWDDEQRVSSTSVSETLDNLVQNLMFDLWHLSTKFFEEFSSENVIAVSQTIEITVNCQIADFWNIIQTISVVFGFDKIGGCSY